jgi:hypothetical protein
MDIETLENGRARVTISDDAEASLLTSAMVPVNVLGFLAFNALDYRTFRRVQKVAVANSYPAQVDFAPRQLRSIEKNLWAYATEKGLRSPLYATTADMIATIRDYLGHEELFYN